ncbi:hypothetical protein C4D60_Mb10t25550 [Musa balbisiana]|uniref:Uncharacterized protein n=1 Tax=Musa balbisiana TaxID=52838 RepID=A0A4S8J287_MUSBA|nr:hypothetical protein C4D60_Mb10t25550 [Musa balbisiana]
MARGGHLGAGCGYEYERGGAALRSSGFSRAAGGAPDAARRAALLRTLDPTPLSRFQGGRAVKQKR